MVSFVQNIVRRAISYTSYNSSTMSTRNLGTRLLSYMSHIYRILHVVYVCTELEKWTGYWNISNEAEKINLGLYLLF